MTAEVMESPQPCEDCGGRVVAGPEPVAVGAIDSEGSPTQLVDFCTHLDCPTNHVLAG